MKLKSPDYDKRQELVDDLRKSDSSKPIKFTHPRLNIIKNRPEILEKIADKWSTQGFYPSSCRAMIALLEGVR